MAHVQNFVEDQEERLGTETTTSTCTVSMRRPCPCVEMSAVEVRSNSPVLQVMASPYVSPAPSACSSASPVVSPVESESEDDVVIVDWQPAPKQGELRRQ
ncbi:Hypothetical predicted protein, partial [Drosophila guanche]